MTSRIGLIEDESITWINLQSGFLGSRLFLMALPGRYDDVEILKKVTTLWFPPKNGTRPRGIYRDNQRDSFQKCIAMRTLVLDWALDAQQGGDSRQQGVDGDRLRGEVEDGPRTEAVADLVDGGEVRGAKVIHMDNPSAGLGVDGNSHRILATAFGGSKQRAPPYAEHRRRPAVDGTRSEDGNIKDVPCGQNSLFVGRTPSNSSGRLVAGKRGSRDSQVADATVGRAVNPGTRCVDESQLGTNSLVFRQRSRAIAAAWTTLPRIFPAPPYAWVVSMTTSMWYAAMVSTRNLESVASPLIGVISFAVSVLTLSPSRVVAKTEWLPERRSAWPTASPR